MPIRNPGGMTKAYSVLETSLSGVKNNQFFLPQDCDSVVVRVYATATFSGTSPTCDVYFQTTDDGGTTWRDCVHFTQITTSGSLGQAQFQPIPVAGGAGGRGLTNFVGSVQASTAAAGVVTGLPILSQLNRVSIQYGGTVGTNTGIQVDVLVNSQGNRV